MPRGCPAKRRERYIRIKLKANTYLSWITRKRLLGIKSDNALACYFVENSIPDKSFNLGNESVEPPILPSLFCSPEGSPNGNIFFSTPIREATMPRQQRSLQALDASFLSSDFPCQEVRMVHIIFLL